MKIFSQSSMSIPNIQWDSMSKEIFHKVIAGATWKSRSHTARQERAPLLEKRQTFSMNEPSPSAGTIGRNKILQRPHLNSYVSKAWPPSFHSHQLPTMDSNRSVCISEVCRTATPLLPPVQGETEGVSWAGAAFLIVNAALGIGILNFPAAYDQAGGIAAATLIQLCMLALLIVTMLILARCSDINSDVTYHDVLMSMCGSKAQKLAALSIICTCFGVGVAVLIIIGDQLDRLFLSLFGSTFCHTWFLERHFTVAASTLLFVLPLCYCKRVDFLRYAGSLGIFAMLYPVFLTVYGYYKLDLEPPVLKTEPDDLARLCAVVPVLCLAYQSQEVVVPVYACLKERTVENFTKSCFLAMGFLLCIYSVIGCFGYLTFGTMVQPNVMKMYDATDPVVLVGVGALIIKMIVTYPVLALCGRGAVDGLYAEFKGLSAADFIDGEKKRRIVIASLWFLSSLLTALYTSSIGRVISLLSSVTAINVFVYPGICLMSLVLHTDKDLRRWRSCLLVAGAIFLAGIGAFFFGIVLFNEVLGNGRTEPLQVLCVSKS